MNIDFHRLPGGYCSQAVRDDGVTVHIPGFDRTHAVPHDLAHFAAERGFGNNRGFWGSVAAGAMFGGMRVLTGRRPPHAAERSKRIITANSRHIGDAEALADVVFQAFTDDVPPDEAARRLAAYWARIRTEPCPYGTPGMARSLDLLRDLGDRWQAVTAGGVLTVDWDLPIRRVTLSAGRPRATATIRSRGQRGRGPRRHR